MNKQSGFGGIIILIIIGLGIGGIYLQKNKKNDLFQKNEEIIIGRQESDIVKAKLDTEVIATKNNNAENVENSCQSLENTKFLSTEAFLRSEGDGLRKSSISFSADGKFSHSLSDYSLVGTYSCVNDVIIFIGRVDGIETRVEYNSKDKSFIYRGHQYKQV